MTIFADELIDLFDNMELVIDHQEPPYPYELTLHGEEVREFLAYKLMKLTAQIKTEDNNDH